MRKRKPRRRTSWTNRDDNALRREGFVFCNFHPSYKLTPSVLAVWVETLKQFGRSVLWLLESNNQQPENLRREAARRGVDGRRLVFAKPSPMEQHLARLTLADLFLDSLPCNAHATASEALWMGSPLRTCKGNTFAGRVADSLLNAADLPELVAETVKSYAQLAI